MALSRACTTALTLLMVVLVIPAPEAKASARSDCVNACTRQQINCTSRAALTGVRACNSGYEHCLAGCPPPELPASNSGGYTGPVGGSSASQWAGVTTQAAGLFINFLQQQEAQRQRLSAERARQAEAEQLRREHEEEERLRTLAEEAERYRRAEEARLKQLAEQLKSTTGSSEWPRLAQLKPVTPAADFEAQRSTGALRAGDGAGALFKMPSESASPNPEDLGPGAHYAQDFTQPPRDFYIWKGATGQLVPQSEPGSPAERCTADWCYSMERLCYKTCNELYSLDKEPEQNRQCSQLCINRLQRCMSCCRVRDGGTAYCWGG